VPHVSSKLIFGALAVIGAVVLCTGNALALPQDPSSIVAGEYTGWIAPAQNIAKTIYMALIIFDFIALAITTLLFRENLGEFFSSLSLKVLMGGVFFWLIANGPTLTYDVINYFKNASSSFGGSPANGPDNVVAGFLTSAVFYFTAASLATGMGDTTAISTGVSGLGFSDVGSPLAAIFGPESFILFTEGLGLMVTLGAFAILLQFSIVTIESYLVMSVGTLMIGFAGSRFTFPFSQGYFSYMINVGIKLLVTYIILGVVGATIIPIVIGSAATVVLGAALPYGGFGTSVAALAATAISAAYVFLAAGVIWTIPAFTAALLTGQSQSSGSAILQQAIGSMAGAAQMFSQFGAAGRALADGRQGSDAVDGAHGGAGALGAGSQTMSPAQSHDSFAPDASAAAATSGTMVAGGGGALGNIGHSPTLSQGPNLYNNALTDDGPVNPRTGMSYSDPIPVGAGSGLISSTPAQISTMTPGEFREQYRNTNAGDLSEQQRNAIEEFHYQDARELDGERFEADRERARMSMAYGLSGAAQAASRDIGAPTAVQVRVSDPDKL
jgi:type IV secretion system protein TrbL